MLPSSLPARQAEPPRGLVSGTPSGHPQAHPPGPEPQSETRLDRASGFPSHHLRLWLWLWDLLSRVPLVAAVVVVQNATVLDLKKAIQRYVQLRQEREGGIQHISW